MIVICTKCQAKFRIADDKIGPRGAKVRCSRCKDVFVVRRGSSDAPLPGSAQPRAPAAAPADLAASGPPSVAAPPDPFAGADPFAAAPVPPDPFAATATAPAPDPFAAADGPVRSTLPVTDLADVLSAAAVLSPRASPPASAPPAAEADPFAAPAASAPPAAEADPFAVAPAPPADEGDPFAVAPAPSADEGDPFHAPAPFPELEPPSVPFPALDGVPFAAAPAGATRPPPSVDPFGTLAPAATPAQARGERAAPQGEAPGPGDLALEDRLTPPPRSVKVAPPPEPEVPLDVGAIDPFAAGAPAPVPADAGSFDAASLGGGAESVDLAAPTAPAREAPPPLPPAAAAPPAAEPAPSPRSTPRPEPEPEARAPRQRASRMRSVAVNAVALAALLLVTLAIWVVWHAEGPLEAGSLRPSAILAALRREGPAAAGPWAARDVGSGVYERARGAPLLFVRGRVASRAGAPVAAVRVKAEVVRGTVVLARGEALAGGVPNPEELHDATDAAALARVVDAARARSPGEVRPGDSVPFLVVLGEAPADLQGASIRLAISPAERSAPSPAAPAAPAAPATSPGASDAPPAGAAPPGAAAAPPGGAPP